MDQNPNSLLNRVELNIYPLLVSCLCEAREARDNSELDVNISQEVPAFTGEMALFAPQKARANSRENRLALSRLKVSDP